MPMTVMSGTGSRSSFNLAMIVFYISARADRLQALAKGSHPESVGRWRGRPINQRCWKARRTFPDAWVENLCGERAC